MGTRKIIKLVILLIWLYLIFYLSNQPADISSLESKGLFSRVLTFFNIDPILHNPLHNMAREFMHFFEYFILGFILYTNVKEYKIDNKYFVTISLAFLYSVSDEIHQVFVPGRTFEYLDISLDLLGIILSALIIIIIYNKKNVCITKKM